MRQGQQNRRGRGRNNNNNNNSNSGNNNRKSQNPLTRSFESTGPDVKVRGTPAHVAEKYISLARDALSSGDRVLAENYLQHAEHYNRIILTYREQQMSQGGEFQGHLPRAQTFNAQDPMDGDEFGDEDGDDISGNTQPLAAQGEGQPQGGGQGSGGMPQQRSFDAPPRYDNRPQRYDNRGDNRQHNNQRNDRDGNRYDRGDRQDRGQDRNHDRGDQRNFNRNDRNDNRGDRQDNRHDRFDRSDRQDREPREFRDDRGPAPYADSAVGGEGHINGNGNGRPPRRERFAPSMGGERQPAPFAAPPPPLGAIAPQPVVAPAPAAAPPLEASEQPAFLRRPVRRPRREDVEAAPVPGAPTDDVTE